MNCRYCVYYNYDNTTGLGECELRHDNPEWCPDFYDKEEARNDAKLRFAPEGKD